MRTASRSLPEPRRPSNRHNAWANWRARVEHGAASRPITNAPECGLYKAKRAGQFVAVQIDLIQSIDEVTGELTEPESFVAFVGNDSFYEQSKVEEIWLRCGGSPITEEQFERLLRAPHVADLSRSAIV